MSDTNEVATSKLTAPEKVCGGCAASIKNALGSIASVATVDVDVDAKTVTVKHGDGVSRENIAEALDRAGFSAV